MNSFYSTLYGKFAGLQVEQTFSARFVYPANGGMPFLKGGSEISDCVVGVPAVHAAKNAISFGPFAFPDSEFGQEFSVKLAVASTCLLSAKSVFYWLYRPHLKEWIASKPDPLRAGYIANVILDVLARKRIQEVEGKQFYRDVLGAADALAALLLSHRSNDYSKMTQTALASFLLQVPVRAPTVVLKTAQDFVSELGKISISTAKIASLVRDRSAENNPEISELESGWAELGLVAEALYAIAARLPGKWHSVYLPYSNSIARGDKPAIEIFEGRAITEDEFARARQQPAGSGPDDNSMMASWGETFFEMVREENRRERLMEKMRKAARNLNFGEIGFPTSDFVSYYKLFAELSPQIRRMIERVRMVKNVLDEDTFQESGSIDLQVAIQAVASESPRNDMFIRDENLLKNECWTILVDSSLSLSGSSRQVKTLSICLAETAREVIGSGTWGMFAFSDELYCIKDFTEHYDAQAKARIGGLAQRGLSHIPDAIRACRSLAAEHAKDRNYLILVSDGLASGYPGIEQELTNSIKELGKYGIDLAVIGIGGASIKKLARRAKVINEPEEIVKEFLDLYNDLSS